MRLNNNTFFFFKIQAKYAYIFKISDYHTGFVAMLLRYKGNKYMT